MSHIRPIAAAAALFVAASLAGCAAFESPQPPSPAPQATETGQADETAVETAPPLTTEPSLVPGGTAEQNQAWFDQVNQQTLQQNASAGSHELVDALSGAGFDKQTMEVTFDRTNVDLDADYIIVSVRFGEECLIGQRGPRGYASQIAATLGTGKCLVGHTQSIDW